MESFVDFCKDYIVTNIGNYDGIHPFNEIGELITDGMNCDGTFTYSRYEAIKYINEWWDECGDYITYENDEFGHIYHNPFDAPEAFTVAMVIRGVESLLAMCNSYSDDDQINLEDENVVNNIIEEIKEIDADNIIL